MNYCKVSDQIFQLIRTLEEEKKRAKEYEGGILLGDGEVQFLHTLSRYPDENGSELAKRLSITKGAVTQMVTKLVNKKLLETTQRHENRQKKYFVLTPKAHAIMESYRRHHDEGNQRVCKFVTELDERQALTIFRFLEHMKECVPFSEFLCTCDPNRLTEEDNKYETTHTVCTRPTCHP